MIKGPKSTFVGKQPKPNSNLQKNGKKPKISLVAQMAWLGRRIG